VDLNSPPEQSLPVATVKRKKPVPLPRTKAPQAHNDMDIYENIGPIKQEDGRDVSMAEYHQIVRCTAGNLVQRSKSMSYLGDGEEEEDTTENTGDSGISEWRGK
jgi:hypothetical protein